VHLQTNSMWWRTKSSRESLFAREKRSCIYKHNSFIYYLLLCIIKCSSKHLLQHFNLNHTRIYASWRVKWMRMRKLASRLLESEREERKGMEEGPLKECWPTTDSLPKLAKIKQDEKLSWCCRAIVGLLESQSSWSGITKILILRFDQKTRKEEQRVKNTKTADEKKGKNQKTNNWLLLGVTRASERVK
jgi:hypothetical protein